MGDETTDDQDARIAAIAERMAGPVRYTQHAHDNQVLGFVRQLRAALRDLDYRIMTTVECRAPIGKPMGPLELARSRKGWSLREAARQTGVSASMLSRYEQKGDVPSLETARKIAKVYGALLDELWPDECETVLTADDVA